MVRVFGLKYAFVAAWILLHTLFPQSSARAASSRRLQIRNEASCRHEGCSRKPYFGDPQKNVTTHCSKHRLEGQDHLYSYRCRQQGCTRRAYFGSPLDRVMVACSVHKDLHHVNVHTQHCQSPDGCPRRACYGHDKDRKPLFCSRHKGDDHVEVVNRRCIVDGCLRRCTYGDAVERRPLFCSAHRTSNHTDVCSQLCEMCTRRPLFGSPEDGKVRFCRAHKQPGDIDLRSLKCKYQGCNRQPSFGDAGTPWTTNGMLFCAAHRDARHVNLRTCRGIHGTFIPSSHVNVEIPGILFEAPNAQAT